MVCILSCRSQKFTHCKASGRSSHSGCFLQLVQKCDPMQYRVHTPDRDSKLLLILIVELATVKLQEFLLKKAQFHHKSETIENSKIKILNEIVFHGILSTPMVENHESSSKFILILSTWRLFPPSARWNVWIFCTMIHDEFLNRHTWNEKSVKNSSAPNQQTPHKYCYVNKLCNIY